MAIDDTIKGINKIQNALSFNNNNPLSPDQTDQFRTNGFLLPSTYSSDGTGLPFNKVPSGKPSKPKRNIITWFVPEFGIIRMYVNPSSISYVHKKAISRDRTKGGYTLQYWGEELTTLNIAGTTGSSGIEGINMLYEIYRSEQYAFDGVGLTLAANNAAADVANNAVGSVGGAIGGLFGGPAAQAAGSGLLGGILGLDSPNNSLSAKNIPSLAQLAFGVEMYYNGWVYRGFFDNMTINEKANDFLIDYTMTFVATQRRGYRLNYFPWSRSATDGPSNYTTPNSFSGNVTPESGFPTSSTILSRPLMEGLKSEF